MVLAFSGTQQHTINLSFSYGFTMVFKWFRAFPGAHKFTKTLAFPIVSMDFKGFHAFAGTQKPAMNLRFPMGFL